MPVDEVRAVLAAADVATRARLLAVHLDRMQTQLAQTEAAVASLRSLLEHPVSPISVERRSVPAVAAIAISDIVARADIGPWWVGAFDELYAVVNGRSLIASGPPGGLFDDALFTDDRGAAVLFIPVRAPAAGPFGRVKPGGRVEPYTVPAADVAVTVHNGSHANVDQRYGALGTYVAEHGHALAGPVRSGPVRSGPVRETYVVGRHDTADTSRWRTEIGWPI
jgi:GyrI-like small molecule binding domain